MVRRSLLMQLWVRRGNRRAFQEAIGDTAISPGRVCIRAALYGSARIMELYVCGATTCRRAADIELTVPTEGEYRRPALMHFCFGSVSEPLQCSTDTPPLLL